MDKKVIIIIVLTIALVGIIAIYILNGNSNTSILEQSSDGSWNQKTDTTEATTVTISKTGEITATLEENLGLHATYFFEQICVEENEYVAEGEKIVEYTNGTYLLAPYDCIVTEINVPEEEEKCTNEHYVTVKAVNKISMSLSVNETQINSVSIGQEASLYVTTLGKTYAGYVTNISSTANNGNFTVVAEFENDGDLKIGMTGKCSITVI